LPLYLGEGWILRLITNRLTGTPTRNSLRKVRQPARMVSAQMPDRITSHWADVGLCPTNRMCKRRRRPKAALSKLVRRLEVCRLSKRYPDRDQKDSESHARRDKGERKPRRCGLRLRGVCGQVLSGKVAGDDIRIQRQLKRVPRLHPGLLAFCRHCSQHERLLYRLRLTFDLLRLLR
jgi:hypothetical protein